VRQPRLSFPILIIAPRTRGSNSHFFAYGLSRGADCPPGKSLSSTRKIVTSQIGLIDYLRMVRDGDVQKRKI